MPAAKKTARKTTAKKKTDTFDAIALLTEDHKEVQQLFKEYDKLSEDENAADEDKQALAEQICAMLTVHTQIEEEIFYPAAQAEVEEDLVEEAIVEHASAKDLIAQIQQMDPSEEMYDAKVKVLGEYIEHHVQEEEKEMFPQAKKAKLPLEDLGRQMLERKQALMAELGFEEEA